MRTPLKRAVEVAACHTGLARLARAGRARGTVVLAYHNIVPGGQTARGDASLHLPQREFARQLDLLRRTHDVVPLSALNEPRRSGARRPRAVITFDDACQGAVTVGVEELARRGLPATFFVVPTFVGGRSFWWDRLASASSGNLSDEIRRHALEALAGRDDGVRRWASVRGVAVGRVPDHQTGATEPQLRAAEQAEGIGLASHTWSHPNLTRLEDDELIRELRQPLAWLRERFRGVVPWVSYPYGLTSERVQAATAEAGYEGALLVTGGWLPRRDAGAISAFALPRQNIPAGLSLEGFELRISGLLTR